MSPQAAAAVATIAVWSTGSGCRGGSYRLRLAPPAPARAVTGLALVCCVTVAAVAGGTPPTVLVLAGVVAAGMLRASRRRVGRLAQARRDADVVRLCFAVAAELRAGRTSAAALAAAAGQLQALGPGVAAAARAVGHGALPHEELAALAGVAPCPRLLPLASIWEAGAVTGARVAEVLERVGRALAQDDEAAAELGALSAGPRATTWVLCLLPVAGIALGTAVGASPLRVLLHTTLGVVLVAAAALLDLCGVLWVRRITAGALAG